MKFHIPFTIANTEKLKRSSRFLIVKNKKSRSRLREYLKNCDIPLTAEEYKAIRARSLIIFFLFFYILSSSAFVLLNVSSAFVLSFGVAILFSFFIFFSQSVYPKVYDNKRVRNIERNLIAGLEDMLVQLNSGIPLFNIIVNISASDYGELSDEFRKAAKKINAGFPQIEVLEELGEKNSSKLFKRTLWQMSNGMRAGSDISIVIKENVKSLYEEQLLQIQTYGNKLNPLIMFYLIISVILPALSITFLTILASMLGLPQLIAIMMFMGLFVFVVLVQIIFLGTIRSIRPTLI